METHDENCEYPFPCLVDACTRKFVRKTDLQRHNQSVHLKERKHRCDYCSRMFARKDTLRRHMNDGCSKRFDLHTLDLRTEDSDSHNPDEDWTHPEDNLMFPHPFDAREKPQTPPVLGCPTYPPPEEVMLAPNEATSAAPLYRPFITEAYPSE